jgi:hypothetical protein
MMKAATNATLITDSGAAPTATSSIVVAGHQVKVKAQTKKMQQKRTVSLNIILKKQIRDRIWNLLRVLIDLTVCVNLLSKVQI